MAEEKITIVDLRKAIAKQTNTEEAQVGFFLTQLIAAVKEGLKSDKQVKISGLGTFKLQWVEPRKSVNISTGEPIVIEGYQKLSFSPEPGVKERINEPYADLVPVELDADGNPLEPAEKPKSDRMQRFDEQALEIKDLLTDLGADLGPAAVSVAEAAAEEEPAAEAPVVEESVAETPAEEPIEEEAPADSEIDKAIEAAEATVAAVREIPKQPIADDEEPASKAEEPKKEEPEAVVPEQPAAKEEKPEKPFHGWLVALITIVICILIFVAAFFFFQKKILDLIDNINHKLSTPVAVVEQQPVEQPADVFVADTILADSLPAAAVAEAAEAEAPAAPSSDFYKERNYTDFIGMETVKEGSRLTWIAKKYYGSKDLWVFIYEANKEKIKNPSNVVVGMQLRIPALPEEILDPDNIKAQRFIKELQDKYLN